MKTLVSATFVSLAAFAMPAMAADLVEEVPAPVIEAPASFSWTGGYVGLHAGYGWGDASFTDLDGYNLLGETFDFGADGFLGGVQAGYNWQRGSFVFGAEAEIGYLNLDDSALQPGSPDDTFGVVDGDFYAGLSARLGFAAGRTLIYAKAGGVYSAGEMSIVDTCNVGACGGGLIAGSEDIGLGYQLGAGVEHAFTDNWTLKLEYAFFDFGSSTINGDAGGGATFDYNADLHAHTIKIGLNYKF